MWVYIVHIFTKYVFCICMYVYKIILQQIFKNAGINISAAQYGKMYVIKLNYYIYSLNFRFLK